MFRLRREDKSIHSRALKVYRDILLAQRLKDEALEMLSIDSSQSLNVGQRPFPKEPISTSSQQKFKFPRMGYFNEDFEKVSSSPGHEKRITLSDFPIFLDDIASQNSAKTFG